MYEEMKQLYVRLSNFVKENKEYFKDLVYECRPHLSKDSDIKSDVSIGFGFELCQEGIDILLFREDKLELLVYVSFEDLSDLDRWFDGIKKGKVVY